MTGSGLPSPALITSTRCRDLALTWADGNLAPVLLPPSKHGVPKYPSRTDMLDSSLAMPCGKASCPPPPNRKSKPGTRENKIKAAEGEKHLRPTAMEAGVRSGWIGGGGGGSHLHFTASSNGLAKVPCPCPLGPHPRPSSTSCPHACLSTAERLDVETCYCTTTAVMINASRQYPTPQTNG